MKTDSARALAGLLLVLAAGLALADNTGTRISERGLYKVRFTTTLEPLEINRMHTWTLHLETRDGEPVANADIELDGGMPAHDHGLPTRPRVTEYLGEGDYRVEGMRFHMAGEWQITISIRDGATSDSVVFTLYL